MRKTIYPTFSKLTFQFSPLVNPTGLSWWPGLCRAWDPLASTYAA